MRKKKKINIAIWVLIAFFVVSALLPVFISLSKRNENKTDDVVIIDGELEIVDYSIEFENTTTINLKSGEIIVNDQIDNVFINVNGYGYQDLNYSQMLNINGCYVVTISPTSKILGLLFDSDTFVTVDIYVEYANLPYKVSSQVIIFQSDDELDIIDYSINFSKSITTTLDLISGEITTTKKIDSLSIYVNGHGYQDLNYSQTLNIDGYYVVTISPTSKILGLSFNCDTHVMVEIYVEYENLSYKVLSQEVYVYTGWSPSI